MVTPAGQTCITGLLMTFCSLLIFLFCLICRSHFTKRTPLTLLIFYIWNARLVVCVLRAQTPSQGTIIEVIITLFATGFYLKSNQIDFICTAPYHNKVFLCLYLDQVNYPHLKPVVNIPEQYNSILRAVCGSRETSWPRESLPGARGPREHSSQDHTNLSTTLSWWFL